VSHGCQGAPLITKMHLVKLGAPGSVAAVPEQQRKGWPNGTYLPARFSGAALTAPNAAGIGLQYNGHNTYDRSNILAEVKSTSARNNSHSPRFAAWSGANHHKVLISTGPDRARTRPGRRAAGARARPARCRARPSGGAAGRPAGGRERPRPARRGRPASPAGRGVNPRSADAHA